MINEALITKALQMTRDYTMKEIAALLEVREEDLRAAIVKYSAGDWKDPEPVKEEPRKKRSKK